MFSPWLGVEIKWRGGNSIALQLFVMCRLACEDFKMGYEPCVFEREDYLQNSEIFEGLKLDDVENELSEHNHDISDIAYELAYSRYRIAKLEKIIKSAIKQNLVCRAILEDGINT